MIRFSSLLTLITFVCSTIVQAFPKFIENENTLFSNVSNHYSLIEIINPVVATVAKKGNILKAAESLTSKDTLKSLGISMVTAGITHGLLNAFDLPTATSSINDFGGHAAHQSLNMLSKMAAETTFTGKTDGEAAVLGAIAGTLGAQFSSKIGELNRAGDIDVAMKQVLHTLTGAGCGLIIGGEKGMGAGALGAFVATAVAEVMMPTNGMDNPTTTTKTSRDASLGTLGALGNAPVDISANSNLETNQNTQQLTHNARPVYTDAHIAKADAIARLTAGMVAFAAGMTPDQIGTAVLTATTALTYNCAKSAKMTQDGVEEEASKPDDYDTDDEAETTAIGKLRNTYAEPIGEAVASMAKSTGADKILEAKAEHAALFQGTVDDYVTEKLNWTEQVSGRPLTAGERQYFAATFAESYGEDATAFHMMEGAGKLAMIPGKLVDWFLRHSGATDKGTARAVGHMVNDGLAVWGTTAAAKGLVKAAVKGVRSLKSTPLPANYEKIISQIPGRVISHADALNPGVLSVNAQKTFSGGRYATITLNEPLTISRVWAPLTEAREFGGMWGLEEPLGILQSRIDKAMLLDWGDIEGTPFKVQATHYVTARIPAGREIYIGEVSSQGGVWVGGTSQIIVKGGVDPTWKIGEGVLK